MATLEPCPMNDSRFQFMMGYENCKATILHLLRELEYEDIPGEPGAGICPECHHLRGWTPPHHEKCRFARLIRELES